MLLTGAAEINKNNIYGSKGAGGMVLKMLDEYRGDVMKMQIPQGGAAVEDDRDEEMVTADAEDA